MLGIMLSLCLALRVCIILFQVGFVIFLIFWGQWSVAWRKESVVAGQVRVVAHVAHGKDDEGIEII